MITATPQNLADAVVSMLKLDPPPAEADIDAVLLRMSAAFSADPEVTEETRKLLHARFEIRMDLGDTLTSKDENHIPWLDSRRGEIDPFYWNRYRQLLLRNGWPPLVASTLDRATDELVDLIGNPVVAQPWKRRGLVMGDVQSGKTATYAALMCKAADAGYRMIVLLTGTLENVRRQTQERLDEAFIGFDSRDFLASGGAIRRKRHIGVGLIDGRRDGVVFTSRDHDFRKQAASALNISLNSVQEPVLVVTKKNKRVLDRLAAWLRAYNADRDGKIDMPLLLIDDEADNASVNTRQEPDRTTSINAAIRDLLGLFRRSSYVGFTATPFANIFIEPESTDEWLGDDLFPRDFIHVLKAPDNYVGMDKMFGLGQEPEDAGTEAEGSIRTIADADHWLPPGHKPDTDPGALPGSLITALETFLLSCAIRDLRGRDGGGIHRSMLVNVTHLTAVQNRIADSLHLELEEIRRAVRLHGALPADQAAASSPVIAQLAATFEEQFGGAGQTWDDVLRGLHDSIAPVKVQPVNASTGAKSLDYTVTDQAPGVRVIAVGGNTLSRGLTLEGLCVSYFLRRSQAYDTLLQMGRWFGYRAGYGDLCRLWMTEEAEAWYRHIASATAELKADFARMKRRKATPIEFGLRVRRHTDSLLITARNKMASGIDVDVTLDVSLVGRGVETARLYSDRARSTSNLQLMEKLFGILQNQFGAPQPSPWGGALIWNGVPASVIADFLDEFAVHPLNYAFQPDSIAEFLRSEVAAGDAPLWTVALPTAGEGDAFTPDSIGQELQTRRRLVRLNKADGSLLVSGRSARVGGKADVRHGIARDALPPGVDAEGDVRALMSEPLLVTYLLRGVEREPARRGLDGTVTKGAESSFKEGMILPALALHFPGEPDPSKPGRTVRYRLNRVAQRELLGPDDWGAPEPEDENDDDD